MSLPNTDIMAALFGRPPPTRNATQHSPKSRPPLLHTNSMGVESPSTAQQSSTPMSRPVHKRPPRRTSSSFCASSSSPLTFYNTSYNGQSMSTPRKSGACSPFAGSAFTDSPSARAIPLPPTTWFEDEEDEGSSQESTGLAQTSDTESMTSTDSISSTGSSLDGVSRGEGHSGVRINPLQLIAAVSAS